MLGCMLLFFAICIRLQVMAISSSSIVGGSAGTIREGSLLGFFNYPSPKFPRKRLLESLICDLRSRL